MYGCREGNYWFGDSLVAEYVFIPIVLTLLIRSRKINFPLHYIILSQLTRPFLRQYYLDVKCIDISIAWNRNGKEWLKHNARFILTIVIASSIPDGVVVKAA